MCYGSLWILRAELSILRHMQILLYYYHFGIILFIQTQIRNRRFSFLRSVIFTLTHFDTLKWNYPIFRFWNIFIRTRLLIFLVYNIIIAKHNIPILLLVVLKICWGVNFRIFVIFTFRGHIAFVQKRIHEIEVLLCPVKQGN